MNFLPRFMDDGVHGVQMKLLFSIDLVKLQISTKCLCDELAFVVVINNLVRLKSTSKRRSK